MSECNNEYFIGDTKLIGEGWVSIVREVHDKLKHLDPHYQIDDIKEKFGGLRYYFTPSLPWDDITVRIMDDVVSAAEYRCSYTCEVCGERGRARPGGWVKTLCDEHAGAHRLEHSDVMLTNVHSKDACFGEACTIHNRSDHAMRAYPQHWRDDRKIMERICPHGVGHPDPDDYKIGLDPAEAVHGCDGCCVTIEEASS